MPILKMPGAIFLRTKSMTAYQTPMLKLMRIPHELNWNTAVNGKGVGGFVVGQVLENGVPISSRVMCYHRRTGTLIAKTWSDAEGNFRFDDLEPGVSLFLTTVNDKGLLIPFNAVTEDLIVSQPLPEEPNE